MGPGARIVVAIPGIVVPPNVYMLATAAPLNVRRWRVSIASNSNKTIRCFQTHWNRNNVSQGSGNELGPPLFYGLGSAPHGCVFHALRCDPSRCVMYNMYMHGRFVTERYGTHENAFVWGGGKTSKNGNFCSWWIPCSLAYESCIISAYCVYGESQWLGGLRSIWTMNRKQFSPRPILISLRPASPSTTTAQNEAALLHI